MESSTRPQRKKPSLTLLILIGLVVGLGWGLFFGSHGSWVRWIGEGYVGLLQMTVLPFVSLSLISNIARLSTTEGGRLARVAISVSLVLWAIGILTLFIMAASFPAWESGSFFSASIVEEPESPDWLALFIPSNPFRSLADNLVPAVVLFSIGLGVALMAVPEKEQLLDKLDIAIEGLSRLNKMVVQVSPIGMFGIMGHAAGTMSLNQFGLVQGYLLVYGAASLLLSLWVLPSLIAVCTPFSYRDVLSASRDTLITAFVIGNTFVVIPLVVEAVKDLTKAYNEGLDESDNNAPEYFVPLAYPFPDVGRIDGLVFIPFAAWFYGMTLDSTTYPQLLAVGFVGSFAKPVVTVPLLLSVAEIPSDIFNLYLSIGVVAARFGDLMKAMHLMTFSILTSCVLSGVFHLSLRPFIRKTIVTVALFAGTVFGLQRWLEYSFEEEYSKQNLVTARDLIMPSVESEIVAPRPNPVPLLPDEDPIDRIRRRGIIRVGYDEDELPFAYFNKNKQLVGLDIDLVHQLAGDLKVTIEFVPIRTHLVSLLKKDYFDIAVGGLEGTLERARSLPHTPAYMDLTTALVVPDHERGKFRTFSSIRRNFSELKVAVVLDSTGADRIFPNVETVPIISARNFFDKVPPHADVLLTSAEAGSAWTLEYPHFSVVKPDRLNTSIPLHIYVASESQLEEFLDGWISLKKRDKTIARLYDYWILGKSNEEEESTRWSVIRDVLHWVD